ncbi:unnamed protein product [Trifolium pratense]|uniref:Uncharacterized protein n=1 Tax=Trifolium pratense TaxID=57577 RepID=A0ACB0IXA2_TRIPR|nr:unnamed protein product [Trifolium pratense]
MARLKRPANKNKMESCSSSSQKSGTKSSSSTKSLSNRENEIEVQSNPSNTPQTNQPTLETTPASPPPSMVQISEVLIGAIPITCKTVIEPIQCSQTAAEIKTTTPKIKTNPISKKTSTSNKTKKSKSLDVSKVRKSSRLASGAGRRPAIDKTVYSLSDDDSENTYSGSPKAKSVPEIKTYSKRPSSSKHHSKPSKSESSEEDIMIRKLKKPAPLIHEDYHTIGEQGQKRKREEFEKDNNLDLLAEVMTTQQEDHPETVLPVSASEKSKENVSEKTTSIQFNPFVSLEFDNLGHNSENQFTTVLTDSFSNNPVNTSIFSPLMTSPQTSFNTTTSDFLRNFIQTPPEYAQMHQPVFTDAGPSLPSFPPNFASLSSFCTNIPHDSAAYQSSANIHSFTNKSSKKSKVEKDMTKIFQAIKINNTLMNYTIHEHQLFRTWLTEEFCPAMRLIWHRQVPLKVSIFVWRLLRDKLPTKANLVTRGILSEAAHHCVSGCGGVESAQHLFLSCSTFDALWSLVSSWIGSSLVTAQTLSDHFVQFTGSTGVFEHDVLSCSLYGLLLCGLYGPKETIDCSEAQQTQCIICWTRSRLFPTGG